MIALVALAVVVAPLLAQPDDEADIVHTVNAGDTLISIALAYGVTLDQLLTLNDLHPEALLQIGQRLVVIRAPDFADDSDMPDSADVLAEDAPATEATLGGNGARGELPPAPVADAAAPMRDPADISAQLCYAVFLDENENGMMDAGETALPGATLRLLDAAGGERSRYTTDGAAEPNCEQGLERMLYTIEVAPPPAFGLTSASRLRIDLRAGGLVKVDFGAKQGLEVAALPPLDGTESDAESMSDEPRSLLRELSGLFALGLAAVVFASGMALSIFIRGR